MGRHAAFDKQSVLDNALTLFWSRGYSATSLRQLEEVTELHPGSLYHHFKSKDGLYLGTLEFYLSHYFQKRIEQYLNPTLSIDGLRRFLTTGYRHSKEEQFRNCCFLACTSTELHLLPEQAATFVSQGIDSLRNALRRQVHNITSGQQLSTEYNETTAQELISFFLGLQLLARITPNQHQLDALVKHSLNQILQVKE